MVKNLISRENDEHFPYQHNNEHTNRQRITIVKHIKGLLMGSFFKNIFFGKLLIKVSI